MVNEAKHVDQRVKRSRSIEKLAIFISLQIG